MKNQDRRNHTPDFGESIQSVGPLSVTGFSPNVTSLYMGVKTETYKGRDCFEFDIFGSECNYRSWKIEWSKDDLLSEYAYISEIIRNITRNGYELSTIEELARIGYHHYNIIFPGEGVRNEIEKLIGDDKKTRVSVNSNSFIYPWSALYSIDPSQEVDPKYFLGLNSVFYRMLNPMNAEDNSPPFEIEIGQSHSALTYGWSENLPNAEAIEVNYIRQLKEDNLSGRVTEIPAFVNNNGLDRNLKIFDASINDNKPAFIHLACHAENGKTSSQRKIQLRNATYISERDLENAKFEFSDSPIVFINACSVAFVDPNHFASLIQFLLKAGARAVLAPECRIDDERAARFAKSFLQQFFEYGMDLSDALYNARRERFDDEKDLTGIAYALYGQADAKISKGK